MTTRVNKDINPVLLKFGIALAVSFAGFLFSRIRAKCKRPLLRPPPSSPSPSDVNKQDNCRAEINDDVHKTPRTPSCREMTSNSEGKPFLRVRIDNGSSNSSPSTKHSSDRDGFLLAEFNKLVEDFDMAPSRDITGASMKRESETPISSDGTPKGIKHVERDEYEQEIQSLKNMVRDLQERERSLEMQLLEYYGLKEQETTVMELQNRLKINNVEAKVFALKIESLLAENRRLEAQVADYSRVVAELQAVKAKVKELKKKLRSDAEQNKEQILKLKQRVLMLQLQEQDPHVAGSSGSIDPDMLGKLQRLEVLENERDELRKSKCELQRENSELGRRLESTQILATSMFEDPEVGELHNEIRRLQAENENLAKEVERLQADRCTDAEELVYLRWINACLRYELRNYQPPPGKTVARDLSKSLSPKSESKAKQLILEYANNTEEKGVSIVDFDYDQWSSSQSYETDHGEPDEPWVAGSLAKESHHSKKLKLFDKLRRLITGKHRDDHDVTHSKPSTLLKSRSVEDLRKAYPSVQRCNSISTPTQNSTRSSLEHSRAPSLSLENTKYTERMKGSSNSTRSSAELKGFTTVSAEVGKDMETVRMNRRSKSASSSHGYKRFVLGSESAGSASTLDGQPGKGSELSLQRSNLVRYAEALKDSPWTQKKHRKAASISAL